MLTHTLNIAGVLSPLLCARARAAAERSLWSSKKSSFENSHFADYQVEAQRSASSSSLIVGGASAALYAGKLNDVSCSLKVRNK